MVKRVPDCKRDGKLLTRALVTVALEECLESAWPLLLPQPLTQSRWLGMLRPQGGYRHPCGRMRWCDRRWTFQLHRPALYILVRYRRATINA